MARKYPKVKGLYYWGGEYIWAGDIGGSWNSLFNWDGKARKGLDAFKDLLLSSSLFPLNQQDFSIYYNSEGRTEVRSNIDMYSGIELIIYDLQGKMIHKQILDGKISQLDFKPGNTGMFVAAVLRNGHLVYREKVLISI